MELFSTDESVERTAVISVTVLCGAYDWREVQGTLRNHPVLLSDVVELCISTDDWREVRDTLRITGIIQYC